MQQSSIKTFIIFAIITVAVCSVVQISLTSDLSDAAINPNDQGSPENPLTSLEGDVQQLGICTQYGELYGDGPEIYIKVGSYVNIERKQSSMSSWEKFTYVSPGFGLSIDSEGNLSGTISKSGTIELTSTANGIDEDYVLIAVSDTTFVSSVSISGQSSVDIGDTITLEATVSPSDGYFTGVWWYVDDASIIELGSESATSTGATIQIEGLSAGTTTIRCEVKGDNNATIATASKQVTVNSMSVDVSSISISGLSSGEVGDTITLTATSSPSSATDRGVTFSITSGSTRATITSQSETSTGGRCTIDLESAGSITVTATASDGSGVKATKTITITEPEILVTSVTISGSSSVDVGDYITLTARTSPSDADNRHVYWEITSGSSRASLSNETDTSTGGTVRVTGISPGSVTIRAYADDGSGEYASKTITVNNPTNSFTLSFNANNGSGAPSSQSGTSTSSTYTFTIPATVPYRSGYDFDGWATSSGGSAQYQPGGRITVNPGTTTLYAVWSLTEYTCHLNFSAPGASNVPSGLSYTGTSTSNHSFTIPSQTPTMSGQIFKGWATSSGGTAQYQPGQTISVGYNSTMTLYAVWESAQLEITSAQGDATLTVGDGFTYTVGSSVSGCTVSVTGADWLTTTGDVVSGTPTTPGTFDVTVTISKAGYISDSQSFTLTVVSALGFTSVPTNGLVIVEV